MIKISGLSKAFGGKKAVDNISFAVAEGENVVLLGKSGCGKTTCLKMLNRLIEPDAGTIEINGKDIRKQKLEALRRGIGYVIQDTGLFPHYTVAQNIALVPRLLKWEAAKIKQRTQTLMEKLHLPADMGAKYPQQLSGGQQQRVGLARALAADPPIILMDEPFGALDPLTRSSIRQEFLTLDELQRKTIVMVTHDMPEAIEFGDRIILMDDGHIAQEGPAPELLFSPRNELVRDFFAASLMQLQMTALRLAELRPYMPQDNFGRLNPDTPLLQALEQLNSRGAAGQEDMMNDLMLAFSKYKQEREATA